MVGSLLLVFRQAGHNLALNAAVILASQELDVAVIAPIIVPRVGNQPIRSSVFDAPAEDANGVATKCFTVDVLVDTCLKNLFYNLFQVIVVSKLA